MNIRHGLVRSAMILSVLLVFSGCGSSEKPKSSKTQSTPSAADQDNASEKTDSPEEATAEMKNEESASSSSSANPLKETEPAKAPPMNVKKESFGKTADGREVTLFTCVNSHGLVVKMIDYGATLVTVETPDKDNKLANINLGFDNIEAYEKHSMYFGCIVGRYANRIGGAKFTLGDKEYALAANTPPNHLHGGVIGFNRVIWAAEPIEGEGIRGVRFTYTSPDGEEGYPGNLNMTLEYILTDRNELRLDYQAVTDAVTVINLTNHAYWNLAGASNGTIHDQEMTILADQYTEVDEGLIPTGQSPQVAGTPFDFTEPHTLGSRMGDIPPLGETPPGYDLSYILRGPAGQLTLAARARDPQSGRILEAYTTQPAIQLYTSNYLDGGEMNGGFPQHAAFCLETQHYPDSPNHPEFPTTELHPGEKFHEQTVYRFLVEQPSN